LCKHNQYSLNIVNFKEKQENKLRTPLLHQPESENLDPDILQSFKKIHKATRISPLEQIKWSDIFIKSSFIKSSSHSYIGGNKINGSVRKVVLTLNEFTVVYMHEYKPTEMSNPEKTLLEMVDSTSTAHIHL